MPDPISTGADDAASPSLNEPTENAPLTEQSSTEGMVDLHSGKGMKPLEANEICRADFTTVILFAGTAQCGKTTLLSSLLLLFQRRPFANHLFAGSKTLVGFEERNYHVEIVSELAEPTQERTKFTELLHLRVRGADLKDPPRNLLLCDLSGEDFREAKDSMETCQRLDIIRRADRFVLLVDGANIADFSKRNKAKNDATTLLRSCLDSNMLDKNSIVDVLITKWDRIAQHEEKTDIESFAAHIEESLLRQNSSRVWKLSIYRVAAHPHTPDMPLGFGLDKVFESWLDLEPIAFVPPQLPSQETAPSEYDRFLWRGLSATGANKQ